MRPRFLYAFLLVFCLVSSGLLIGQMPAQTAAPASASITTHAPDNDTSLSGQTANLFIPLATGQPFHAKITVEVNRQLPDSTTVLQKSYTLAARDSNGREYRELRDFVPADSDREPPIIHTVVYDPKTSLITTCIPDQRICRQLMFDPTQHPVDEAVGPSSDGKSVLAREDLGAKTIDGVRVTGTRETRTFVPGAFGNDKPVVVTKEIWYSPELQFNLSVTRLDPRNGTQKLEVTDLKLGEPGLEWFAIPDGYRMVSGRGIPNRSMYPAELEPVLEKSVPGMLPDQLATALQPVEAAIGAYAKAHQAASPKDNNDIFAGQLRMRLSSDLRMMQQQNMAPQRAQLTETDLRMKETFREVVNSACIDKPQPGDPANVPSSADALRAEQTAWLAVRDAWSAFLAKLFPNSDPGTFAWMLTNERDSELRRLQNVERNRGCIPEETIEPMIAQFVTGLSSDQLDAAIKPVDAAISAFAKAHAAAEPNQPKEQSENFVRMTEQQLSSQLRMQQRDRIPTQDQFEEADLHLNQAFRAIISSPCLTKPIPGDPPNAPVSEAALREEERTWIAMRDAWTAFMAIAFPGANQANFGTMLTEMRTGELQQIQTIERNRGCGPQE